VTAIRVLIADDHAVVRQGLRTFLELQDDIEVVADVADGEAALRAAAEHEPDVVLMDLVMPGGGGVEAIRALRTTRPEARVLVLTSFLDDDKVFPAVRAGAAGYLLKDVEPAELVRAIRTVDDGEALLHPAVAARLMEEFSETERPAAEPRSPWRWPVTEIRVLIADDHAVVRQGLRTFLELQDDIEVVADVADGEAALRAAAEHEADVVLMDLVMPGIGGVEAIRRLREVRPAARVLVLTSFLDDEKLFPAVRAGAAGYLLKDVEPAELVRAIRAVGDGEALLHPAVAARLMEEFSESERPAAEEALTAREREVLELIARGLPNKLIARDLEIAEKTVKTHVSSILSKLGLTDRTQAALYAVRTGLIES